MRTRVLAALALAVPTALAAGPAGAAKAPPTSPYPPSTLVAGIAWDATSYRSAAPGGDIWPVTSGAGGGSTRPGATGRCPAARPRSPTAPPC